MNKPDSGVNATGPTGGAEKAGRAWSSGTRRVLSAPAGSDLPRRFRLTLEEDGLLQQGDRLLVAVSGGLDSVVLLHLLRFTARLPSFHLVVAHFDHGMRSDSVGDRQWVGGLCRAWEVPVRVAVAAPPPGSENEAREQRYRFLLEARVGEGAKWILTGHQGDDQAETVLFRAVRGTGLKGLAGIPRDRHPGIYRPLLPFSRPEILQYAVTCGIRFRQDPTNRDTSFSRNLIRHTVLPALEANVAPGARDSLRRLARLARENEAGWESLLPGLLQGVLLDKGEGPFVVRSGLQAYHPAVQSRLLREILRRQGILLDEAGTRLAVEFTRTGVSGGSLPLPGNFRLVRELDGFRILSEEAHRTSGMDTPGALTIRSPENGVGELKVGGATYVVAWGESAPEGCEWVVELPSGAARFPLSWRGVRPGDRIQLAYGTKKLKKLFLEARIPARLRARFPVLVDGDGRVLWVPGLATSTRVGARERSAAFFFGIRHVHGT